MAKIIVIAGKSSSGKSTSIFKVSLPEDDIKIEGLNPKETFLINIVGKELQDGEENYKEFKTKTINGEISATGNYIEGWDYNYITQVLEVINKNPNLKSIVIDDAQYLLSMDFFERRIQSGFDKYAQMGFSFVNFIMKVLRNLRSDILVFILMHTDEYKVEKDLFIKLKTIGKMLDEKFTIEGLFSTVLVAQKQLMGNSLKYSFRTLPHHEEDIAKSLLGMFTDDNGKLLREIPNDLGIVKKAYDKKYNIKLN